MKKLILVAVLIVSAVFGGFISSRFFSARAEAQAGLKIYGKIRVRGLDIVDDRNRLRAGIQVFGDSVSLMLCTPDGTPRIMAVVPADGPYLLSVGDVENDQIATIGANNGKAYMRIGKGKNLAWSAP